MASGRLGHIQLNSGYTLHTLYTCPADTFSVVTVSFCNKSNSTALVNMALGGATPTDSEYLEFETEVPPKSVLERTGIVVEAGLNIVVQTNGNNINAVCYGIESEA